MNNLETQKVSQEGDVETVAGLEAKITRNVAESAQLRQEIAETKENKESFTANQIAGKLRALENILDDLTEGKIKLQSERNKMQQELNKTKLTGKEADKKYSVVSPEDAFDNALRRTGEMADADRLGVRRSNSSLN